MPHTFLRTLAFTCLLPLLVNPSALGEDDENFWPRFRGPNGTGIPTSASAENPPPLTWSENENLQWKLQLPGPGSSGPIISGDRIFVTCYSGYGTDAGSEDSADLVRHLIAVNRADGSIIWKHDIPNTIIEDPYRGYIQEHGYASQTPCTDGERIYCFFGKTGVVAFDWDGKELWRREIGSGSSPKRWGSATSPILHGDLLIVNASDEAETLFGIDTKTGDIRWKSEASSLAALYGTPVLHKVDDERTDIIVSVLEEIWGVNPETGNLRWFASNGIKGNASASAVTDGKTIVAFGGFPNTIGVGVKAGGKGDLTDSHNLWTTKDAAYMVTPLFHDGRLYWVSDSGIARCSDPLTGEVISEKRLPDTAGAGGRGKPFYASPVLVDGHVVSVSRTAGAFVLKADPDFELVRVNKIAGDDSQFNATPAVAPGQLVLRSDEALYSVGPPLAPSPDTLEELEEEESAAAK